MLQRRQHANTPLYFQQRAELFQEFLFYFQKEETQTFSSNIPLHLPTCLPNIEDYSSTYKWEILKQMEQYPRWVEMTNPHPTGLVYLKDTGIGQNFAVA